MSSTGHLQRHRVPCDIGFPDALRLTLDALGPLPPVSVPVLEAADLAAAEDCRARASSPSVTSSLKDGFAVSAADIAEATTEKPVRLTVRGSAYAGSGRAPGLARGQAVRVTTGAMLPEGADAVLAVEFARDEGASVLCLRDAPVGKNIQRQGEDVAANEIVVERGLRITPARAGLLAAAGLAEVCVHPRPSVGVLATGDEVVLPGEPLKPGQLYASNIVTLLGWLRRFGMVAGAARRPDSAPTIREAVTGLLDRHDALLTSGGAWKSERDLTVRIMEDLGGELLYERVRIGPGKAVALAVVGGKPVFCLPGGPSSNEMAFLQLALPGLLRLAGLSPEPFERRVARLDAAVEGTPEWTQFFQATLAEEGGALVARPLRGPSRMRAQALAEAIVTLPQGCRRLDAGMETQAQILHPGAAWRPVLRPDTASPENTSR